MNLNAEVICDFKVSTLRKKVWQAQLDMVKIFIDICDKYKLKYFAAGGTLIGAIRHNGFIPWDDDIDLMMPREDYEKFIKVAKEELKKEPYFLQHYSTEKDYPNGHAQIRNSNTTCFIKESYSDLKKGKNCGIFIDIFPYDVLFDNYRKRQKYCRKIKLFKALSLWRVYTPKSLLRKVIMHLYFFFHSLQKTILKVDNLSKNIPNKEKYNMVALASFMPGYEKNVWAKEWFDQTLYHQFEDIQIAIPLYYDEVLKKEYGDYMTIPEHKGGAIHGQCYFNCDIPYEKFKDLTKKEFDELFLENQL